MHKSEIGPKVLAAKEAFNQWKNSVQNAQNGGKHWNIHCRYSVNAASLACTYGVMLRIGKMLPDNVLIQSLIPVYAKMQKQFDKLCAEPDAFDNIKNDESKHALIIIINGFGECCDEILETFQKCHSAISRDLSQ